MVSTTSGSSVVLPFPASPLTRAFRKRSSSCSSIPCSGIAGSLLRNGGPHGQAQLGDSARLGGPHVLLAGVQYLRDFARGQIGKAEFDRLPLTRREPHQTCHQVPLPIGVNGALLERAGRA